MTYAFFPSTQGELIRHVRAGTSQKAFAEVLDVSRSCLSRYESEELGAPPKVINHCLGAIAAQMAGGKRSADPITRALQLSRDTTKQLEQLVQTQPGSSQ